MAIDDAPGIYVLVLHLPAETHLTIGRLGAFDLHPGYYLYVGSAFGPGGLAGRLRHHRRPARHPHWHIDYLRAVAFVGQVWFAVQQTPREHEWAALLATMPGVSVPFPASAHRIAAAGATCSMRQTCQTPTCSPGCCSRTCQTVSRC